MTGPHVIPAVISGVVDNGAMPLCRYAQMVGYTEPAMFGLNHPDNIRYACRQIWTKPQRDEMIRHLRQAQALLENYLEYPLQPTWITGVPGADQEDRFVDQQAARHPLVTRWGRVIAAGQKATAAILLAAPVVLGTNFGVVGPIPTAVTDADEVHVFLPGTDLEVHPSSIVFGLGSLGVNAVTITIPRARLVAEAYLDNPATGWDYQDDTYFAPELDVWRVYNDPTASAQLARPQHCAQDACLEETATACLYVEDRTVGVVHVTPATDQGGGHWHESSLLCGCGHWHVVRLWYLAGVERLDYHAEDALVRLAHALMPNEPCACDSVQAFWKRDRYQPEVATRERLNCPFGLNDGAWFGYNYANANRLMRVSIL